MVKPWVFEVVVGWRVGNGDVLLEGEGLLGGPEERL